LPRLSEMPKSGYVKKDARFDSESLPEGKQKELMTIYRITTLGIHRLNNLIDKKQVITRYGLAQRGQMKIQESDLTLFLALLESSLMLE